MDDGIPRQILAQGHVFRSNPHRRFQFLDILLGEEFFALCIFKIDTFFIKVNYFLLTFNDFPFMLKTLF